MGRNLFFVLGILLFFGFRPKAQLISMGIPKAETVLPLRIPGDYILNEKEVCQEKSDILQNIYLSPDRNYKFAFQLIDSTLNIFEVKECVAFIGEFKKCYWTSNEEIIIESDLRFSPNEKDYFSIKLKDVKREKHSQQEKHPVLSISLDSVIVQNGMDEVEYCNIYGLFLGKSRIESYDSFLKKAAKRKVFIKNIKFRCEPEKRNRSTLRINESFDFRKERLKINFTSKVAKFIVRESDLYFYTWSYKDQEYIKEFKLNQECVHSMYFEGE